MKKLFLLGMSIILFACAPALDRNLMKEGERNPSLDVLRTNPGPYKGKLYIIGGVIVETRLIQTGSQVEVLSLPVNSRGYLQDADGSMGRFLAIYPKEKGLLDPLIFKKGRNVTIAGVFLDSRPSKLDDMEYMYPIFEIRQIHLWEEPQEYAYPYPPYYPGPYWYNPYWGPYWPPMPSPAWW